VIKFTSKFYELGFLRAFCQPISAIASRYHLTLQDVKYQNVDKIPGGLSAMLCAIAVILCWAWRVCVGAG